MLRPFFARYDEEAIWLDDLEPAFGEEAFFFEGELAQLCEADLPSGQRDVMESLAPEGVEW